MRRALGAGPREILWLILREGLGLGAAGVAAGLALDRGRGLGSATAVRHFAVRSRHAGHRSPSSWR